MTWNNGSYWGTSASTTMIYPVTYTNTSATTIAVGGSYAPPAPRAPTALEWLDSEVESTCARARG